MSLSERDLASSIIVKQSSRTEDNPTKSIALDEIAIGSELGFKVSRNSFVTLSRRFDVLGSLVWGEKVSLRGRRSRGETHVVRWCRLGLVAVIDSRDKVQLGLFSLNLLEGVEDLSGEARQ